MKDQYEYKHLRNQGNPAVMRKQMELLVSLGWEVYYRSPVEIKLRREPPQPPRKQRKKFAPSAPAPSRSSGSKSESPPKANAEE